MEAQIRHTVCIVTYRRSSYLTRCLEALRNDVSESTQVVVVDASPESDRDAVHVAFPTAEYVHDTSVAGWMTRARNVALLSVKGRVVSFLDDDVVVRPGWQAAVLAAFEDAAVAAVAGRTCNGIDGEEHYAQPVGRLLPDGGLTEGFASLPTEPVDVDHGIGANMSFRTSVIARLGGFRDDYPGTAMREDTDIYLRVRAIGGRAVFAPEAVVDHLPAPHVTGARFDTRYKLYARRNHMVLLARDGGLRSPVLRRWIGREFRSVVRAPGLVGKASRFGVTAIGIGWGALAAVRDAAWNPTPPTRSDAKGARIRAALDEAAA